ncbi:hypothetical protein TNCV_4221791 [Trichonephila clavipes]|nr:hypothetical protein TNCV_4221791 [Trichonephila clavipes]
MCSDAASMLEWILRSLTPPSERSVCCPVVIDCNMKFIVALAVNKLESLRHNASTASFIGSRADTVLDIKSNSLPE